MIYSHRGASPDIHESAYIAPNAVVCGDVTIGPEARVLFGAVLTSEGGAITIGAHAIVMEHAVLRGTPGHPLVVEDHVLIGPHAHVIGATVGACAFVATGASVFNGARVGARSDVRINAVVHVGSVLEPDSEVPIGWIAVGDPAHAYPPEAHEEIWPIQRSMNFPERVFGVERAAPGESVMVDVTTRYARALARHRDDRLLD